MKTAVLFFLIPLSAFAQIEAGTLIVVNPSQDEIVVAADSRGFNETAVFDDRCKITALGNQLVFSAAGKTVFISSDKSLAWDSHTIARDIFLGLSLKGTAQPPLVALATAWGEKMKDKLKVDLRRDRKETLFGITQPGVLLQGVFAGFDGNAPLALTVGITYTIAADGGIDTNSAVTSWRGRAIQIGKNEIAAELFSQKTERARSWAKSLTLKSGFDGVAVAAIESVRFSIENYGPVDIGNRKLVPIGGQIDAVKLTQSQGIQWLQIKPNCPED